LKLLENNIVETLKEIKSHSMTSLMKSNDILKSYYAFIDSLSEEDKSYSSKGYLIINSPIYGAIYSLEDELRRERKLVSTTMDNNLISVDKSSLKSKMSKSKISDLLTADHDKKRIVNTNREFFNILEKNVVNEY